MRKPQVLILNGVAGAGKDTFAKLLGECAKVEKISIIDLSKEIATLAGWDGVKGDRSRQFLCDIKDLIDQYNGASFFYLQSKVAEIKAKTDCDFIIIDAREIADIEKLVATFDAISIYIKNDNIKKCPKNKADLDAYYVHPIYDMVVTNNGSLYDFKRTVTETYLDLVARG